MSSKCYTICYIDCGCPNVEVRRRGYFVSSKPERKDVLPVFGDVATRRLLFIVKPEDMDMGSPKVISGLQPVCVYEKCKLEILPANAPDIVEQANSPDVAGVILEILIRISHKVCF